MDDTAPPPAAGLVSGISRSAPVQIDSKDGLHAEGCTPVSCSDKGLATWQGSLTNSLAKTILRRSSWTVRGYHCTNL